MNTSTKIFIGIIVVVFLLTIAELTLSHFLAQKYAHKHAPAQSSQQPR